MASLLTGHFRVTLSRGLAAAARRWASGGAAEEADRLAPIVEALSQRYLGPDYGDENTAPRGVVLAAQLPTLARQSFPLCMKARTAALPAAAISSGSREALSFGAHAVHHGLRHFDA